MERPQRLMLKHILRKIFLEDWAMKLVALGITLALWFGVTGLSKPGSERYNVPLNLRLPDNTIIMNAPAQEVEIKISGDDRRLQQIKRGDLAISVDLSELLPGDRVVTLDPSQVSIELPTGIKLDEIQPNKIAVRLETAIEKEVAVKAETDGDVPEGFEIYGESIVPQSIRVRGPASFIRSLAAISTEKIDLRVQTADFTAKQVPVVVSNPKATPFETVVDVNFRIGEKRIERTITIPAADSGNRRIQAIVFGPRSLIEQLNTENTSAQIVHDDAGEESARLILPPEFSDRITVQKVRVLH